MIEQSVSEQVILDELHQLPMQRWPEVLNFMRSLQLGSHNGSEGKRASMSAADLLQSGLVGMWAHRTDMADSREFARRLREKAQTRRQSS